MQKNDPGEDSHVRETLAGRVLLLMFGVGVLGFLVAIDHADWFSIRPATGTSLAMARASDASSDAPAGVAKPHP